MDIVLITKHVGHNLSSVVSFSENISGMWGQIFKGNKNLLLNKDIWSLRFSFAHQGRNRKCKKIKWKHSRFWPLKFFSWYSSVIYIKKNKNKVVLCLFDHLIYFRRDVCAAVDLGKCSVTFDTFRQKAVSSLGSSPVLWPHINAITIHARRMIKYPFHFVVTDKSSSCSCFIFIYVFFMFYFMCSHCATRQSYVEMI